MERLTRTQKYAELRDEVSHDREESLNTQQIEKVDNHLSSFKGYEEQVINRQQPTSVVEDVKKVEDESIKSLDEILNSMMKESYNNSTVKPVGENNEPRMAQFVGQPNIQPVEQNVNNNFINNTFSEVNNYNKEAGQATLDDLSNQLVNEVRHPENKPAFEDDFSRTISLELNNVLNEIETMSKSEPANNNNVFVKEPEPVRQQPVEVAPVEEVKPIVQQKEVFEHPVMAQTQEAVEIKNITETVQLEPVYENQDVVDDTIPFTVNRQEDEDDDEYEDEEPSKALNIILGILIFVLVAVLGVIVYYILIAKGIIK